MAYTRHGHHINGTVKTYPEPQNKARCGGPGICGDCNADQVKALVGIDEAFIRPDTPKDVIVIGEECVAYGDENVISWKGQEYVKTCGAFVKDLPDGGKAFCTLTHDHPGLKHVNTHHLEGDEPHVEHARRELQIIGEDPDVIEWYVEAVRAFMAYGHSGGSFVETLPVFNKLLRGEHLSALTDDPDEWYKHSAEMWDGESSIWQNKRNTAMLSTDKGKTYWDVNHPENGKRSSLPWNTNRGISRHRAEHFG